MTTQHTIGQWRLILAPTQVVTDNAIICTLQETPDNYAEKLANARLIAAAPELLAFAKATAQTFGNDTMIGREARAAIAKVTVTLPDNFR